MVATKHAAYGPGSRSRARRSGRAITAMTTANGKKIDVYFEAKATPVAMPTAVHHRSDAPDPIGVSRTRTMQYTPTAIAASSGASGVARIKPAAASGRTLMTIAARTAAESPPSRRAVAIAASVAIHPATTGPKRMTMGPDTPNGARTKSPARMSHAMAGGWSKYPAASRRDQSQ